MTTTVQVPGVIFHVSSCRPWPDAEATQMSLAACRGRAGQTGNVPVDGPEGIELHFLQLGVVHSGKVAVHVFPGCDPDEDALVRIRGRRP
ncbi:hypothetical protein AAHB34_09130 [Paenarthrobacter ureafaciens]